jgi:hypothetical protein
MLRDARYCSRSLSPGDAKARPGFPEASPRIRTNRQGLTPTIEAVLSSEGADFAGCDQNAWRPDDARSNSHSMKRGTARGFSQGETPWG